LFFDGFQVFGVTSGLNIIEAGLNEMEKEENDSTNKEKSNDGLEDVVKIQFWFGNWSIVG